MVNIERNAPCPCGSGKKYKKCCGAPKPTPSTSELMKLLACLIQHLGGEVAIDAEMIQTIPEGLQIGFKREIKPGSDKIVMKLIRTMFSR